MKFTFSFKHMDSSDALSEYAETKLASKIEKFSTKPIEAHTSFLVEAQQHIAHCTVKGGDGFNCDVEARSDDMYASVDLLIDKLEVQLRKQKERLKNHKSTKKLADIPLDESKLVDPEDPDEVPVEADDVVKYEKARRH